MGTMKAGLIGCGMISEVYLRNCTQRFGNIEMLACANRSPKAAQERAEQFNLRACSVDELLDDPDIQIVMNLTPPDQHFSVSMRILQAGKHVYSEKPLAVTFDEGKILLDYADKQGLSIGCAPDTFLGGGWQTSRRLLDKGAVGEPFAGQAFMLSRGPEHFHPNPAFFYQQGAGPTLDWGPYYISTLVFLLGPIKRVGSIGRIHFPERKILTESSPKFGETFTVEVLTYIASILEFVSGAVVTLTLSFDMPFGYRESDLPFIRLYGLQGSLTLPDTNQFGGPIYLREGDSVPKEVDVRYGFTENSRGMGLSDMVHAIDTGGSYRANAEFALHTLEVLLKMLESSESGEFCELETTCKRPEPLPENLPEYLFN